MAKQPNNLIHQIPAEDLVHTPLGDGQMLGQSRDNDGNPVYLVRIAITPEILAPVNHVKDENCLTQYAVMSGIWQFDIHKLVELNPTLKMEGQNAQPAT